MAGLLSGLEQFGLSNLENMDQLLEGTEEKPGLVFRGAELLANEL